MPYKTPPEVATAGVASGASKSRLSWDKALVAGFLGGADIALAGPAGDRRVSRARPGELGRRADADHRRRLQHGPRARRRRGLGAADPNMALLPLGFLARRLTIRHLLHNFGVVLIKVTMIEPGGFRTDWAGSSMQTPDGLDADYEQTVGAMIRRLRGHHSREEGDPDRAARVILDVVELAEPPLWLLLAGTPSGAPPPSSSASQPRIESGLLSMRTDCQEAWT